MSADTLIVAGHEFSSRLIIGTGKYKDYAQNANIKTMHRTLRRSKPQVQIWSRSPYGG